MSDHYTNFGARKCEGALKKDSKIFHTRSMKILIRMHSMSMLLVFVGSKD